MLPLILSMIAAPLAADKADWSAFPYDGFVPENGIGVHDPSLLDFKGRYVSLNTSGNSFGQIRTSRDLIHWTTAAPVMAEAPEWLRQAIPQHRSVWAPEVTRFGENGLRMYYCASTAFGRNNSWIGVAQCDRFDPDRPGEGWRDLGPIIDSKEGRDNFNAIDPSVLVAADGGQWMFFGSYWSGVYVAQLDPSTGKLLHADRSDMTLVARNPADRANGIEAPSAIYRDGYYYLFANYGLAAQGVRSTYQIVVGRSKAPNGPFVDSTGKSMVEGGHESFLNSSPPMFGPGGGTPTRDIHGRWLISHHYYDGRRAMGNGNWGVPTLQVREMLWSADGWPLPGLPVTPETESLSRRTSKSPVGKWRHQAGFGNVEELEIRRDGTLATEGKPRGKWLQTGGVLRLEWSSGFTDEVMLANGGNYYVGRNGARAVVRGVRHDR